MEVAHALASGVGELEGAGENDSLQSTSIRGLANRRNAGQSSWRLRDRARKKVGL